MIKTVCFINENLEADFFELVGKIAARRLGERAGVSVTDCTDSYKIYFSICESAGKERYTLCSGEKSARIEANSKSALLTGFGTFMRAAELRPGSGMEPAVKDETHTMKLPVRGMYFASHNRNFYTEAPIELVIQLIEDLSLWGMNLLKLWYDMKQLTPIDGEESEIFFERMRRLFIYAKRLGMKTMLAGLANEAPSDSPVEMRAEWQIQGNYFKEPKSHYHVELCPSKPGGLERIVAYRRAFLERIKDTEVDFIGAGPYDQGGCTCDKCAPWGANGYLRCIKAIYPVVREYFPGAKFVLSTWYMNKFTSGELELFEKEMEKPWYRENVDYISSFFNKSEEVPEYYRNGNGIAGIPLIQFGEISMTGGKPWGGFGANPLTRRLQIIAEKTDGVYAASVPYSEGLYEDVNKCVCLALASGICSDCFEASRLYARTELSPDVADDVLQLLLMEEESLLRDRIDDYKPSSGDFPIRFVIKNTGNIDAEYALAGRIDAALDPETKKSFRWRMINIRAITDYELYHGNFYINDRCEELFNELIKLYYGQRSHYCICPPTRESLERNLNQTIMNSSVK